MMATSAVVSDSLSNKTPPRNFDQERDLVCATDPDATAVQMPESGHLVMRGRKATRIRPRASNAEKVEYIVDITGLAIMYMNYEALFQDYPRLTSHRLSGLSLGNCMAVHHTGRIYAVSGR